MRRGKSGLRLTGSGKGTRMLWMMAVIVLLCGCSARDSSHAVTGGTNNTAAAADQSGGHEDLTAPSGSQPDIQTSDKAESTSAYPYTGEREDSRRFRGDIDGVMQAGQLTAGEWDDLAAWERFGSLLNSREGDENLRYWSYSGFERLEVQVTANGLKAADTQVLLMDSQGEPVWEARTDADGTAYVYANMFEAGQETSYQVEIRAGQQTKTIKGIRIPEQGVLKAELSQTGISKAAQADIMFVVDTTGSMQDELDYLEAELKDVIGRVSDQHGNQYGIRLGTVFYRDQHDAYVVNPYPFTTNVDKAVSRIADQEAVGGGDYPEAVDQALREAISGQQWSEHAAARLLFLVMDAPPHHERENIDEMHELTMEAASQGIRIIPVASSGVDVETEYLMRFLAVATGGTYLFLTDDSGIGGDHLEPAAGEYEVRPLNDLLVEVINRYIGE